MSQTITDLISEITATKTVVDSATVFITGVPGLIATAVAAAIASGATAAELAPVADLGTQLQASADALKAALVSSTPAA